MTATIESKWGQGMDWAGSDFVIAEGSETAWILRDDGTAKARLDLKETSLGFYVETSESCSPAS